MMLILRILVIFTFSVSVYVSVLVYAYFFLLQKNYKLKWQLGNIQPSYLLYIRKDIEIMGEIKNTDLPKLHGINHIFSGEHKKSIDGNLGSCGMYMDSNREVYSYHAPMSNL